MKSLSTILLILTLSGIAILSSNCTKVSVLEEFSIAYMHDTTYDKEVILLEFPSESEIRFKHPSSYPSETVSFSITSIKKKNTTNYYNENGVEYEEKAIETTIKAHNDSLNFRFDFEYQHPDSLFLRIQDFDTDENNYTQRIVGNYYAQ